jgi:hypothetical protein
MTIKTEEQLIKAFHEWKDKECPPHYIVEALHSHILFEFPLHITWFGEQRELGRSNKRKLVDMAFGGSDAKTVFSRFSKYLEKRHKHDMVTPFELRAETMIKNRFHDPPDEIWVKILDYVVDETYPFFSVEWKATCKRWYKFFKRCINARIQSLRRDETSLLRRTGIVLFSDGMLELRLQLAKDLGRFLYIKRDLVCSKGCFQEGSWFPCRHVESGQFMVTPFEHICYQAPLIVGGIEITEEKHLDLSSTSEANLFFGSLLGIGGLYYHIQLGYLGVLNMVLLGWQEPRALEEYSISHDELLQNAKKAEFIGGLCFQGGV